MTRKFQLLTLSTLCLLALLSSMSQAQITPLQDAYTNSADPTTNYGANVLLDVDGAVDAAYIQFNLASIPSGASVSQATLKLYVNAVTTAGSFDVVYVDGSWAESTITHDLTPTLGGAIASGVAITAADKNQYILVNVTSAVQAWLNASQANDGLALVAVGTTNVSFDSKENTTTSHPAELDIVFAGGGTITGVTTASGSGLTGGGTTGTLNLSVPSAGITNAMLANSKVTLNGIAGGGLTVPGTMTLGSSYSIGLQTCSTNQVLQYNGSAWACAAVGTGTITGVTAGTGLSGGGTSGSVTLNINTSVIPELSSANTFTQNLSTSGELAAGGAASGDTAKGTVEVDAGATNAGTYAPGLNFGGGGQSIASDRAGTVNTKGIDFYTNFDVRMSLTNGGNVGIGTTAPTHLFEVDAAATSAQMAMVSTGTDAAISVKNTGAGGREYWIDSGSGKAGIGSGNFAVWDATAGLARFVIDSIGNVGIGTTSPGAPLGVASNSPYGILAINGATTSSAIEGEASASSGEAWGVVGTTESSSGNAYGVYGLATNTSNSSGAVGVTGISYGGATGTGVYGQWGSTESGTGTTADGVGLWGDAGASGGSDTFQVGVLGTADDGTAGFFENNAPDFFSAALVAISDNATGYEFLAENSVSFGICTIDQNADLSCSGTVSGVVPVDGGARQVTVSAIASPKNWFEDFGAGQLVNGVAVITLDSDFIQTVNTEMDYKVFPVPNGDCKGLYITHKAANSFEVHELGGGTSNVAFDYRITALRRNYENVRFADRTADMKKQREMAERRKARKGSGQSHSPQRNPLLTPSSQQAELRPQVK